MVTNDADVKFNIRYKKPWPEFVEELIKIVTNELTGMPRQVSTLTIRRKYNPYSGEWEKVSPILGPGTKAIINAIYDKWHMCSETDYKIFSLEDEDDKILHIVFESLIETTDIMFYVFDSNMQYSDLR